MMQVPFTLPLVAATALVAAASLFAGCSAGQGEAPTAQTASAQASSDSLLLVYSNNVDGEIEPCG